MKLRQNRSITLIELLVAVSLLSVMVLAFSSIDLFSRFHVTTSDRRAQVQNDVSFVLAHMEKNISQGIGDETNPPNSRAVKQGDIGGDPAIQVWVDWDKNSRRDPEPTDRRIAYRLNGNLMQFCPECTNPPCAQCTPNWTTAINTLSTRITNFTPLFNVGDNFVAISLTGCWDPDGAPFACNTPDNPSVTLSNRIYMPSVSTN